MILIGHIKEIYNFYWEAFSFPASPFRLITVV